MDIPFIHLYTDAYAAVAKAANPAVSDQQLFIGGDSPFSDPARAKEQASALVAQGVDHIFAVASGSNGGIFEATGSGGVTGYGGVGDGTLKLMDSLIPQLIDKIDAGQAESFSSFGLAEGGMDLVSLAPGAAESQCTVMDHPDVVAKLAEIKQKIIDGEITPPDATGKFN